ncbi:MAG: histidine phosphatase family protein [Thermoleophilia bacterium]|nr:histidine phosphatase family protein [Thermoleophilia bacterium]
MTEILLVRHGETDWNLERRVQGQTDIPLNATGIAQAHALADALAGEDLVAVVTSDLTRARDTAAIVAAQQRLTVFIDAGLREKDFGSWEGLTDTEISSRFPEAIEGNWGDGETSEAVATRAIAAVERIRTLHPTGPVLVVSHGGPLRAVLAHFEIRHGAIRNCVVFRASY